MQRDPALRDAVKADLARIFGRLAGCMSPARLAVRLQVDEAKPAHLLRGRLGIFSIERLMYFLTLLGHDIEIVVTPAPRENGQRVRHGTVRVIDDAEPI